LTCSDPNFGGDGEESGNRMEGEGGGGRRVSRSGVEGEGEWRVIGREKG